MTPAEDTLRTLLVCPGDGRYREGVTWTNITLKPCVCVHLSLPASSSLLLEITVTVFTLDPRRGIVLRYVNTSIM